MAEGNNDAAAGGSKKKRLIIIGALVVLLLVGGGVTAMLLLGGADEAADELAEAKEEKRGESLYIDLKPEFVINFRDRNDRAKFLKAELAVSTRDPKVEEAVTRHMPAIRNNLVLLLSRQIYEDLLPNEGKEALRQQALVEVQSVLESEIGKPGVDDLFFSNLVMH